MCRAAVINRLTRITFEAVVFALERPLRLVFVASSA
jgi:hypothetical protein